MEEILAAMPGSVVFLRPLYGLDGSVEDFELAAVSQETVDIGRRRGAELIGRSLLGTYQGFTGTGLWDAYLDVLSGADPHIGEGQS
ncbi:hypothetical protein [Kitasatospora sp. CMC57]|uniref:hypothetical protein n=1 Tax=Kitasatospora sp. CMC57 TaxID=3231513 RepID=UPI0038B52561